ncbi:hypothetical protein [Nocardia wallacei]|uniref:hypothetical protein n=1 Tax=Nocardia wallacei TaxID=480035 RepID=UPI0024579C87|nr:hypothetical protein [Nocardia wallacei]
MTAVHTPIDLPVKLTSKTSARTEDVTLEAGTATIQEAIISYAARRARDSGRAVRLVVTAPTGKKWSRVVEPPEPAVEPPEPVQPQQSAARDDVHWRPPGPGPQRVELPALARSPQSAVREEPRPLPGLPRPAGKRGRNRRLRGRVGDRPQLAGTAQELWQRRGVRYGAAAAAVAAVFVVGWAAAPDGPEMASERPLETFSVAGPGDRTSGPGVIQASNYAYYVWPRTADGVAAFWAPGAAGAPDELQKLIDHAATDRQQFRLEVVETRDPLVYDARLTITTSDGVQHPYAQRYRLARGDDGKYLIASKSDCGESACPPL